ncbi:MAG: antibiotic biosynthesis monooxygenase [Candidatus Korobacteraceae bacterium]
MVQLLVRLVARPDEAPEVLRALRSVLRPATQARGCCFAQIYREANDSQRLEYLEEWDDPEELRQQLKSERFVHLLELLETAAERPVLEFRIITEKYGLEYFDNPAGQPVDVKLLLNKGVAGGM